MAAFGLCLTPVPAHFLCPISLELMTDPVTLSTGITFDGASIRKWLGAGHSTCPVTRQALSAHEAVPNLTLRRIIHSWCKANGHSATSCVSAAPAKKFPNENLMGELSMGALQKLEKLDLFLEDNPSRAIALAQAVPTFASHLSAHDSKAIPILEEFHSLRICEEIVAALSLLQLTDDDITVLAQPKLVSCIGWLLSNDKCDVKLSTVHLLGKLLCAEPERKILVQSLGAHLPGIAERLVDSVRDSPGFVTDPDVLKTLRFLCSSRRVSWKMIELGLVEIAVDQLLPEYGLGVRACENTLALLETLLSWAEGRAAASQHALAIPAIVKKLFEVSKAATECAVNILWKMCRHSFDDRVRYQAVKAGVPAKLNRVMLQIDYCPKTKRRGRDLLRLLEEHKGNR